MKVDAVKLNKDIYEAFVSERATLELSISQWSKKLKSADVKVLNSLGITPEMSLQELIPELYKEYPDVAQYEIEFVATSEKINKLNEYIDAKNEEVLELLQEHKRLYAMNRK